MATIHQRSPAEGRAAICRRVRAAGLDAPWLHPGPSIQPKKLQVQSGLWKWDKIEPLVREHAGLCRAG